MPDGTVLNLVPVVNVEVNATNALPPRSFTPLVTLNVYDALATSKPLGVKTIESPPPLVLTVPMTLALSLVLVSVTLPGERVRVDLG